MTRPETTPHPFAPVEVGEGDLRCGGDRLTIMAAGYCVGEALRAAEELAGECIDASVVDMASLNLIDTEMILERAETTSAVVTVETHSVIGGLGSALPEVRADQSIGRTFWRVGIRGGGCEGGSTPYLMNKYDLDAPEITDAVHDVIRKKG